MKKKLKASAFSLIELSVVITLIAVVTAASLSLSVTSANTDKVKITNERIRAIYKAMAVYLGKNGKLPCVAPINVAKTTSTYGTAGDCTATPSSGSGYWISNTYATLYYGMVPVKTLNLPVDMAEDGFGTKFAYVVLKGFTDNTKFGGSDSDTMTTGSYRIRVHKKIASGTPSELTSDAMFVIISYGPNKSGGWNAITTTQNSASSLTEETWNSVTGNIDTPAGKADFDSYNGTSVFPFIADYSGSAFDDILFWKTRTEMVQDFKFFSLIPCAAMVDTYSYPAASYGEIIQPTSGTACASHATGVTYPARRCGALGNWESYIIWDCTS